MREGNGVELTRSEKLMVLLLRVAGVICLSAFIAAVMPRAWMAAAHEWLTLGPFPEGRIAEYLARTASGLYAVHGVLMLLVARDPRRYAAVITFVGVVGVVGGLGVLAIDLSLGMPWFWTLGEGPVVAVVYGGLLALQAKAKAERRAEQQ